MEAKGYETNKEEELLTPAKLENACASQQPTPDWIVAHIYDNWDDRAINTFVTAIQRAKEVKVVLVFVSQPTGRHEQRQITRIEYDGMKQMKLCITRKRSK